MFSEGDGVRRDGCRFGYIHRQKGACLTLLRVYFPPGSRRQADLLRAVSWGCNGDLLRVVKLWNSCGGIWERVVMRH